MNRKLLGICVVGLTLAASALGQGTVEQNRVVYPTPEEIARFKRLSELLRHPTFITLRLASMRRDFPNEEPSPHLLLIQSINGCIFNCS